MTDETKPELVDMIFALLAGYPITTAVDALQKVIVCCVALRCPNHRDARESIHALCRDLKVNTADAEKWRGLVESVGQAFHLMTDPPSISDAPNGE